MKYIDTIEIKNFKSIRHQRIEGCKRINLFIGYPNVGKSNILEALGLFSLLFLYENEFRLNDICRLQHFSELFFNQDYKHSFEIFLNEKLSLKGKIAKGDLLDIQLSERKEKTEGPPWRRVSDLQVMSNGSIRSNSLVNPEYYEAIVCGTKKYVFKNDAVINKIGAKYLSVPFGENFLDILLGNTSIRAEIKDLFDFYNLRLIIERAEQSIKFYKELNDGTAVSIPYHQVADTLRRLIFYKAVIETNQKTALIFEEPEAHMFPPYIRKFTSEAIYEKNQNQYFIATHSPYVLDNFLEDAFKDTAVFLVDYVGGETVINRLEQTDINEIRKYGVDLFYNLESYLEKRRDQYGKVDNH